MNKLLPVAALTLTFLLIIQAAVQAQVMTAPVPPQGLAVDMAGNLYFTGYSGGASVYKRTPDGKVTKIAGAYGNSLNDGEGGPALYAAMSVMAIAVDAGGNIFLAEEGRQPDRTNTPPRKSIVRKISPNGIIQTVVGTGVVGFSGDGGPAISAQLNFPNGLIVDMAGNLYIVDAGNSRVRKVTTDSVISTVLNDGVASPTFGSKLTLAAGADGNLYFADTRNRRIRKFSSSPPSPGTSTGNVITDLQLANGFRFEAPEGVAIDTSGNIYVVDSGHVYRLGTDGAATVMAGDGTRGYSGDGGPAVSAQLLDPRNVAVAPDGSIYLGEADTMRIRVVMPDGTIHTAVDVTTLPLSAQRPPVISSTIQGNVFDSRTGKAISGAQVTLTMVSTSVQLTLNRMGIRVTTDERGQFAFREIEPGSYRLAAVGTGFTRMEYGQATYFGPGTIIETLPGQTVDGLAMSLAPEAIVSGKVVNDAQAPVPRIAVELLKYFYNEEGDRVLRSIASAATNDRGEYRLFSVPPGHYYLRATAPPAVADSARDLGYRMLVASPGPETSALTTLMGAAAANPLAMVEYGLAYYPATSIASEAKEIEIKAGDDLRSMDILLARQPLFQVSGIIKDDLNQPVQLGKRLPSIESMRLYSLDDEYFVRSPSRLNYVTGEFQFDGVRPGDYRLLATELPITSPNLLSNGGPRNGSGIFPIQKASQLFFRVSNSDVERVDLSLRQAISISGHTTLEGSIPTTSMPGWYLNLAPITLGTSTVAAPAIIAAGTPFVFNDLLPGIYKVRLRPLQSDGYIKSARFGKTDLLLNPLSVSGPTSDSIEITIGTKGGLLGGYVVDKNLKGLGHFQVVLVPEDPSRIDRFQTKVSSDAGEFSMGNIPPGQYKLFAWENIEPYSYYDPAVLQKYEGQGTPISIPESGLQQPEMTITATPVR